MEYLRKVMLKLHSKKKKKVAKTAEEIWKKIVTYYGTVTVFGAENEYLS